MGRLLEVTVYSLILLDFLVFFSLPTTHTNFSLWITTHAYLLTMSHTHTWNPVSFLFCAPCPAKTSDFWRPSLEGKSMEKKQTTYRRSCYSLNLICNATYISWKTTSSCTLSPFYLFFIFLGIIWSKIIHQFLSCSSLQEHGRSQSLLLLRQRGWCQEWEEIPEERERFCHQLPTSLLPPPRHASLPLNHVLVSPQAKHDSSSILACSGSAVGHEEVGHIFGACGPVFPAVGVKLAPLLSAIIS